MTKINHLLSLALGKAFAVSYKTFGPDVHATQILLDMYVSRRRSMPKNVKVPGSSYKVHRYGSGRAYNATQGF